MDGKTFAKELDRSNQVLLDALRDQDSLSGVTDEKLEVVNLLKMALKNEIEATEIAAMWLPSTPEIDVKVAFGRQAGDEAKHYRLIEERLREMGESLEGFDPLAQGHGPLFNYLASLQDTVERVAAGQFTREAIALIKNQQFIEFCEAVGDTATATLYRDTIQRDEGYHHELGRGILEKYAATEEAQERARKASAKTLELAEEMQGLALQKMGVHHAPGC